MGKGYAKGLFNSEENAASANRKHLLCISDYLMGKEETVREPAGSSFWVHQPKADCFVVQWKETIINMSLRHDLEGKKCSYAGTVVVKGASK